MVMWPGMSVYICVFVCLQMKEKWNLEKQMQGMGWSFWSFSGILTTLLSIWVKREFDLP